MTKIEHEQLIKDLEAYPTYGDMIDAILQMDEERKFLCIGAVAYSTMTEEIDKEQIKLFIKIVAQDIDFLKSKKKKLQLYKAVYDKTFTVISADDDTFDIGVDHDKIHEFLVDRLDLK